MQNSNALTVEGLPEELAPDTIYELTVTFENPEGAAAGFQLIAWMAQRNAGTFDAETEYIETVGSAIRSTSPVVKTGAVSWIVQWRTPAKIDTAVTMYLAATSANHDRSPLGDRVHFRSYTYSGGAPSAPN